MLVAAAAARRLLAVGRWLKRRKIRQIRQIHSLQLSCSSGRAIFLLPIICSRLAAEVSLIFCRRGDAAAEISLTVCYRADAYFKVKGAAGHAIAISTSTSESTMIAHKF
jgi:hypothetical protein